MNATKQALWLFFTLIALAGSGWYFASASPGIKLDAQMLAKTADATVDGLSIKQFNAQGKLVNFLESPHMHHIPENDTHIFTSPHIILKQEDESAWDIRSQQASAFNKGEKIIFSQQVVIAQSRPQQPDAGTFKTEELTYLVKQKFASTPLDVTFSQPGTVVQSRGMNAYLAEKHVVLLNNTHAIYKPSHG